MHDASRSQLGRERPPFSRYVIYSCPPTSGIYALTLHDALPIFLETGHDGSIGHGAAILGPAPDRARSIRGRSQAGGRSEEHTSELQSPMYLVYRPLLEKKKRSHQGLSRHDQPPSENSVQQLQDG